MATNPNFEPTGNEAPVIPIDVHQEGAPQRLHVRIGRGVLNTLRNPDFEGAGVIRPYEAQAAEQAALAGDEAVQNLPDGQRQLAEARILHQELGKKH